MLFHPRSQVDGVAHGRVLNPQVGAHLTDDHQAGVDAHPHVKARDAPLSLKARGILPSALDYV